MIVDIKRRALHRSKILQGQLKGVEKMIEDEKYCMDIITQNLAIQKSLSSLNKLILENHLRTHITEKITSADEKKHAEAINELLSLYELTHIRGK
jgi:DNA-binding FrmR family transcriptional regulator